MAAALIIALVLPIRLLSNETSLQQPVLRAFSTTPGMAHQTGVTVEKGLNLKSVSTASSADSSALQNTFYSTDLTSALQSQILASIDIFGSDIKTNKIQITIDLSNVSGITTSEKDNMRLFQIPVSFPAEGQK